MKHSPEPSVATSAAPTDAPQISIPLKLSIRRRLASMLYEALLLLGVLGVTFLLPHTLLGVISKVTVVAKVKWLHIFLVLLIYFVWLWRKNGQTLPMKTWKIKLVDAHNATTLVSNRQALLRYLLAWPSLLTGGVGIFWALFDRDRQFLHDRLAGTKLVKTP